MESPATPHAAPARIALTIAGSLGAMLAVALAIRPEMAMMPVAMVHRLIVGFGL